MLPEDFSLQEPEQVTSLQLNMQVKQAPADGCWQGYREWG
jgi:hypothetical protein